MKKKKTMEQIMNERIYPVWDNISVEKARDELKKMFMGDFLLLTDIEEQRLLLHNLTTAELKSKDKNMDSAKLYSKTLKDILDSYPNYTVTQENKQKYVKVLNNYIECYRDELSKEELIKLYEFCYETYKRCDINNVDGYLNKLIAEFNLNLIKKNFTRVLEVIEDTIHNNKNSQYEEEIQCFINDIKDADEELYLEVKLLKEKLDIKIS